MKNFQAIVTGLFVIFITIGFMVSSSYAQGTQFGIRGGLYSDAEDAFIGAEFLTPVSSHVFFNPNVEYVFVDYATYLTINGDFHYDFHTREPIYLWAGGGPALVLFDPDGPADADNDFGINLIGGIGLKTSGSLIPYFQLKALLSDNDEVVFAFGIRF